jgi:hypothetical protein
MEKSIEGALRLFTERTAMAVIGLDIELLKGTETQPPKYIVHSESVF